MVLKKKPPRDWHLYVIVDRGQISGDAKLLRIAEGAIRGGADAIQLRYKSADTERLLRLARRVKDLCDRRNIPFIINDRPEAVLAVDADGMHAGRSDINMRLARRLIGREKILGISATKPRYIKEAIRAAAADYIGFGPIFKTPIKRRKRPVGVRAIKKTKRFNIPFIFIGGINLKNARLLAREGAGCIAVIRAVVKSRDAARAARLLREAIG